MSKNALETPKIKVVKINEAIVKQSLLSIVTLGLVLSGCSDHSVNRESDSVSEVSSIENLSKAPRSAQKKPNIVFIFADDQSPKTIGGYDNPHIKTPNLDRLAKQGVNFSHAYNMGAWNGAVCIASRTMLNTGRSIWNARAMEPSLAKGKQLDTTWGRLMATAGYDTYMAGKWHIQGNAASIFQTTRHIRPGMPLDTWKKEGTGAKMLAAKKVTDDYSYLDAIMPAGYNRPKDDNDQSWSPSDPKWGGFFEGGKHWSEVLKEDALSFIDTAKQKDNPFFMYIAFNAPHDPRQAPQKYLDMYDHTTLPIPASWQALYPEKDTTGNGPELRDAALAPFPRTRYATQIHLKEYYAIMTHMDEQIGEILAALEASGKMGNTYIIYTADHGLAVGEHGLFGKQNMYEHSVRAPFIIWGPDIKGGQTVEADIYLQDAMATSIELAGLEKPEHVFFNSLLALAKGQQKQSHYDAIYSSYVESQRMIKKDGFKLIAYPQAKVLKLFDINNDPEEMNDLAQIPQYKEKMQILFSELLTLQKSLNDTLDITALGKLLD